MVELQKQVGQQSAEAESEAGLRSVEAIANVLWPDKADETLSRQCLWEAMQDNADYEKVLKLLQRVPLPKGFHILDCYAMIDATCTGSITRAEFVAGMQQMIGATDFQRNCLVMRALADMTYEVKELQHDFKEDMARFMQWQRAGQWQDRESEEYFPAVEQESNGYYDIPDCDKFCLDRESTNRSKTSDFGKGHLLRENTTRSQRSTESGRADSTSTRPWMRRERTISSRSSGFEDQFSMGSKPDGFAPSARPATPPLDPIEEVMQRWNQDEKMADEKSVDETSVDAKLSDPPPMHPHPTLPVTLDLVGQLAEAPAAAKGMLTEAVDRMTGRHNRFTGQVGDLINQLKEEHLPAGLAVCDPNYSTDVSTSCGASVTSSQVRRFGVQKAPSMASSSSGATRASSSAGAANNASSARADSHARNKNMMEACLNQSDDMQNDRLRAMLQACENQQGKREDSFNMASAKLAEYHHSWSEGGSAGIMFADRDAADGPPARSLARTTRKDDPQGFLSAISGVVPSNGKPKMYFDI